MEAIFPAGGNSPFYSPGLGSAPWDTFRIFR
ncbi:hypothetical protein LINPERHAP2_LOCUS5742 [Linum perenne]